MLASIVNLLESLVNDVKLSQFSNTDSANVSNEAFELYVTVTILEASLNAPTPIDVTVLGILNDNKPVFVIAYSSIVTTPSFNVNEVIPVKLAKALALIISSSVTVTVDTYSL
jgi:hypothetical protein